MKNIQKIANNIANQYLGEVNGIERLAQVEINNLDHLNKITQGIKVITTGAEIPKGYQHLSSLNQVGREYSEMGADPFAIKTYDLLTQTQSAPQIEQKNSSLGKANYSPFLVN